MLYLYKNMNLSENILQTIHNSFLEDERFILYTEGFDLIKFCVKGGINKNFDVDIEDLVYHINNKFDHDMLYSFLDSNSKVTYQEYIEKKWSVDNYISSLIEDFIVSVGEYLEEELLFILTRVYLKQTINNIFVAKQFLGTGNRYLFSGSFMLKLAEYELTFDRFFKIRSKISI